MIVRYAGGRDGLPGGITGTFISIQVNRMIRVIRIVWINFAQVLR